MGLAPEHMRSAENSAALASARPYISVLHSTVRGLLSVPGSMNRTAFNISSGGNTAGLLSAQPKRTAKLQR